MLKENLSGWPNVIQEPPLEAAGKQVTQSIVGQALHHRGLNGYLAKISASDFSFSRLATDFNSVGNIKAGAYFL